MWWVLSLILVGLFIRRRASRELTKLSLLALVIGSSSLTLAPPANAQDMVPNLDIQLFRPSPFPQDLFSAPRRSDAGGDHWSVGVLYQQQSGLLSIRRPPSDQGLAIKPPGTAK